MFQKQASKQNIRLSLGRKIMLLEACKNYDLKS